MIQFHKYWSEPDVESIQGWIDCANQLTLPLFEGESGENNLDWYAAAFPMYERNGISWSFWSYKKMACANSPVTFDEPEGWQRIQGCATGAEILRGEAIRILDGFLTSIGQSKRNEAVLRALTKRVPLCLPAEHFDGCMGHSSRQHSADYRVNEPIRIVFANGKIGKVNFDRNAGQPQPPEENLQVLLDAGETVWYRFVAEKRCTVRVLCKGEGNLWMRAGQTTCHERLQADWQVLQCGAEPVHGMLEVRLTCTEGSAVLEQIDVVLS